MLLLLSLLLIGSVSVAWGYSISSAIDFVNFVNSVNSGTSYSGTTVYLYSDISLSGYSVNPIGTSSSYYFGGAFDGQGYVISDLVISRSYSYVGLFGYSTATLINNVVLDDTCSIENTRSSGGYVGGIVGYHYPASGSILNSINMASITFSGSASGYNSYVGGFFGYFDSSSKDIYMENCVNYGAILKSGYSSNSYIGGIIGYSINKPAYHYIYNCANYGPIKHSRSTSSSLYVGGIEGYSKWTDTQNCLSVGKITLSSTGSSTYMGSIVGYFDSRKLNYCYFTSDVGTSYLHSGSSGSSSILNSNLLSILNAQASNNGWDKWFSLHLNGGTINDLNQDMLIVTGKPFPDPIKTANKFMYWCKDVNCTTKYEQGSSVSSIQDLYALWNVTIIKLHPNGGSVSKTTNRIKYNTTYGELPIPTREGYTFEGWFSEPVNGIQIGPSTHALFVYDHTIYAHWDPKNYTVLLNPNGGRGVKTSTTVTFNSTYGTLPTPVREGHRFIGWFTETPGGSKIESSTAVLSAYDHMIYAHWYAIQYTITFVSNGGSALNPITLDYDSPLALPMPERTGYSFVQWCNSSKLTTEYTNKRMESRNVTLYAKWEANEYEVTFDVRGGGAVSPIVVTFDQSYSGLPKATKSGCGFLWWEMAETKEKVEDGMIVKTARNHTLCAVWDTNTVYYDSDYLNLGGLSISNSVKYNEKYKFGVTLRLPGYTFVGWLFNETGKDEIVTEETIVKYPYPHTLYGIYEINNYTITFDYGNGTRVAKVLDYNESVVYPADPEEVVGHTFIGWDKNVKYVPANNVMITAQWKTNAYAITFDYGNGTNVIMVLDYEESIKYPSNPNREGYRFEGWDKNVKYVPANNVTVTARWSINTHTITFEYDNGSDPTTATLKYNDTISYPAVPVKRGYSFAGWDKTIETLPDYDVTITATWTANEYIVTLDVNGGDKLAEDKMTVTFDSAYGTLPVPNKKGYMFLGWFTDVNETITKDTIVNITNDQIFYAQWEAKKYTVTLDVNGGDKLSEDEMTVTFNSAYGTLPVATRVGHRFAGWFTEETEGDLITSEVIMSTDGSHTLYAHWDSNTHTVTFEYDNGSDPTTATLKYNDTISYPAVPVKRGYSFAGWDKDDKFVPAHNLTITATWTANEYTVTLDVNGGEKLLNDKVTVTFNETYGTLPVPSKKGYFFNGWVTVDNINIKKDTVVSIADNHTLYAQWDSNKCMITFDVNGGDKLSEDEMIVTFNSAYGTLPVATKDGYRFAGWFTEETEGDLITSEVIVTIPYPHTLYARWSINTHTVTFEYDNGSDPTTATLKYNDTISYPAVPVKRGYSFAGWDKTIETLPDYDVTITATWTANEYTMTLDVNGGEKLAEDEVNVTFNETYGTLPVPNKKGYMFLGWFTDVNETVTKDTIVNITNDQILYAQWEAKKYAVTLDVNGGDKLAEDEMIVTFNSAYGTLSIPTRAGYTFVEWADDWNVSVFNGTIVEKPEGHRLHAEWNPNNYTVTLSPNGGRKLDDDSIAVTFDSPYGELPVPSREGHTFGWWTDSLTINNEINSTTTVAIPRNHTLYAAWVVNKYKISFVSEDGTTVDVLLNYNDMIIYPNEVPSKSFRKFRRWCTEDLGSTKKCNITTVPAQDLTFVASFDLDLTNIAGVAGAGLAVVFIIVLVVIIVFLVKVIVVNGLRLRYDPVSIELDEDPNNNEEIELRIEEQVNTTNISKNFAKKLAKPLKDADQNKALEEILTDLEVDIDDSSATEVVESFRRSSASSAVANAIRNETNLVAAAEFLTLLYTTVRGQENYETFDELFFGMKDINEFLDKMDEKTICFGGIVSGFTNKRTAIQFLLSKEDDDNMPSGVLFKVHKGKGYRVGKLGDETDEVLFELGSAFKVESMNEVSKDKFIAVDLSFVSPKSKDEFIKLKG